MKHALILAFFNWVAVCGFVAVTDDHPSESEIFESFEESICPLKMHGTVKPYYGTATYLFDFKSIFSSREEVTGNNAAEVVRSFKNVNFSMTGPLAYTFNSSSEYITKSAQAFNMTVSYGSISVTRKTSTSFKTSCSFSNETHPIGFDIIASDTNWLVGVLERNIANKHRQQLWDAVCGENHLYYDVPPKKYASASSCKETS